MNSNWRVELLIPGGALQAAVILARDGKEVMLLDTGYHRQEKELLNQLEKRGLTADSVTLVANTHLHFDHSHNNSLFRKAKILCSRREYEWMTGLCRLMTLDEVNLEDIYHYYPELRSSAHGPKRIWAIVRIVRRIWGIERLGSMDQFLWLEESRLPDGMSAVPTPGHVPHHYSFAFNTGEGAIIVAGDAVVTRGDEDEDTTTFPPANRNQYAETKKKLLGFAGGIIPGHDVPFSGDPQLAQAASTSSIVFGTGSPSTRNPVSVTRTSSSMRMPPKSR